MNANTANVTHISFPYLPPHSRLPEIFQKQRGYKFVYEDGEWRLPLKDRALRSPFPDTLKWHTRIELDGCLEEAARKMVAVLPPDYEEGLEDKIDRPDKPVEIMSAYGISADVRTATIQVLLTPYEHLEEAIKKYLFPLMIDRFGMKYVFPISVFANRTQFTFSMAKICHLTEAHGFDKAKHLVQEAEAMKGIEMSGGIPVLNIMDSLTRFAPISFTLPVNRLGCTWHFYKDGFDMMPLEGVQGAFNAFLMPDTPRAPQQAVYGLFGATGFSEAVIWQMLREGVNGTNRLFAYLSDLRTFLQSNGTVDFVSQLKAFGTVRMLFADLHGMNLSMNAHSRMTFTFGFLDKLANLIAGLRGLPPADERRIFMRLASESQGEKLKEIFKKQVAAIHPKFANAILPAIDKCYTGIHDGLQEQLGSAATEQDRLKRLSGFRNMSHGTFLSGDQFERLYLGGKGELPEEVMTLPILLAWGLLGAPEEVINFGASTES